MKSARKELVNDDDYERFAAENIDEKEMYTNYDGVSLDELPFEELSDFEREKVFGEDEDYDVMFGEPEEVFSIYGKGGGIVGARLAVRIAQQINFSSIVKIN